MTRLTAFVLVSLMALSLGAGPASAQFTTPNRAFHNGTTFPLEGRHRTVACEACHLRGVYKGTPNTCFECHWVRRQDDKYRTRLGEKCEQCHRPTAWSAARWDHGAITGMPLNGAHRTIGCESCHKGGSFKTTNVACLSCHEREYRATTSPNHVAAGFPTTCEVCHRPADATFRQARFDHNAHFPLVGAHATQACASCHRNNVFRGTPRDCVGCHRPQYDQTRNPNHAQAGFPTTCEQCHRPTEPTWRNGGFNHNSVFPLVGVHATQACATCHRNNVFRGTPRDCVGCHRPQYDQTRNPNHQAAGFPTTCDSCHRPTDSSWTQGTFTHSRFPISGPHRVACARCHTTPNNYRVFSCTVCHDRTQTDSHHREVTGYRYDSLACYSCHPNGRH
jgi:hypothetical protein